MKREFAILNSLLSSACLCPPKMTAIHKESEECQAQEWDTASYPTWGYRFGHKPKPQRHSGALYCTSNQFPYYKDKTLMVFLLPKHSVRSIPLVLKFSIWHSHMAYPWLITPRTLVPF